MKNYCEETRIEEFTLHRQGFYGLLFLSRLPAESQAFFVNWFASPIAALILCILRVCAAFFLNFLCIRNLMIFFSRKQTSHNMIAVRKPKARLSQRIVMWGIQIHSLNGLSITLSAAFRRSFL